MEEPRNLRTALVEDKNEQKTLTMVLTKIKKIAEAYLGHDVKDAVVTVPTSP